MAKTYFIGDIHGCCLTLQKLVAEKIKPEKEDLLCFIGDYIDRGPDSKGVVDYIMNLKLEGFKIITLRGNHEQMLLDARRSARAHMLWLMNGGEDTLASFGIESVKEIPDRYMHFFEQTELYVKDEEFIAVHAGLNFKQRDPFSDTDAMLWIRDFPVDHSFLGGKLLIHGHTPIEVAAILSKPITSLVNIDAGCVYHFLPGMGHLVALCLQNQEFLVVENQE